MEPSGRPPLDASWHRAAIAWSSICLAVLAIIAAAKLGAEFVAPTVLAALVALTLSPVVRSLERRKIPSAVASAIVVASVLLAAMTTLYILAPSAEDWRFRGPSVIRSLERKYRDLEQKISEGVEKATAGASGSITGGSGRVGGGSGRITGGSGPITGGSGPIAGGSTPITGDPSASSGGPDLIKPAEPGDSPANAVIESGQSLLADKLLDAPKAIFSALYITFLCYFLLAERAILRRKLLGFATDQKMRLRIARSARDIRLNVSSYLLTLSTVNLALGVAAALIFWVTGLPNPLLWGVMVGLLNFMPYVGPMISSIVIFLVGLATFVRSEEAFLPVFLLIILNLVEGQFVTPQIVGRRFEMGPLAVFLALAFGAWLWGFFGALVATPLLIVGATLWRSMSEDPPEEI